MAALNDFQPEVIATYPSFIRRLADEQPDGRLKISTRRFCSVAEALMPDVRDLARQVWGRHHLRFAATETGATGSECELVAFAFGLLHGLGFAGALSEVGLPGHAIPVALLFFNVGVELGQLIFIAAVMTLFMILRRGALAFFGAKATWSQAWLRLGGAYCIGGVASFWLLERISGFWL